MPDDDRWEYEYLEEPPRRMRDLVDDLNHMGRDGWEAFAALSVGGASMPNVVVLLKRQAG